MDELAALEFADTKSFEPVPIAYKPHIPRAPRGLQAQHYMCGECGKGYKWMANLRRHQRLECGKLPKYHCRMCRKDFYRRYELTNHFNTKHTVSNSLYGNENTTQKDSTTTWPMQSGGSVERVVREGRDQVRDAAISVPVRSQQLRNAESTRTEKADEERRLRGMRQKFFPAR
ncbi:uncharacterized protein LOC143341884 [Colletes latitarsis]|uniref:uncharacterized protein LOC143341884 n=1 Tax=Colletes latitarsis TaxID=2605962 RepID=UPI0040375D59